VTWFNFCTFAPLSNWQLKTRFLKIVFVSFIFLKGMSAFSQPARHSKKDVFHKDTVKKPAPALLMVTGDCLNGISEIILTLDSADTLATPQWVYVYLAPMGADITSLPYDSAHQYGVVNYADVLRNNNRLIINREGTLYVRTAVKGPVFSTQSNTVNVTSCSSIEFPSSFDRTRKKNYSPENMMNVQVVEFDIFDRIGNPVYSSKNNDINWDGTYPDKRPAASGVYYYNCIYIDIASDSQQRKTAAGMIELKN
jgi:hypothetical protein